MKEKLIILAVAVLLGLGVTYYFSDEPKAADIQKEIAEKVLRFHVLANSDSQEDQELKLKVKEAVVEYLDEYLNQPELTLEEAKAIVQDKEPEVIALAEQVIADNGYDYTVNASLTSDYFPVKSYGDITLPAGEYETFRIDIGDAEGKNWWCILYPPLCFVDVTYGYVPDSSKEQLQNVLDKECYEVVTNGGSASGNVEIKFRIVELWKKCYNKRSN
jgi:stage II sporulation protein R